MRSQVHQLLLAVAIAWLASGALSRVMSQEVSAPAKGTSRVAELPLYDQPAYDVMVLDEANQSARLKVLPLPLVRRPQSAPPDRKYVIRLVENDDEQYEVTGRNIRRIELFEELLLKEGNRLIDTVTPSDPPGETARRLAEAYRHFARVYQSTPEFPGLRESVNRCLFLDAGNLNAQKKYAEAFAVLEELFRQDPNYRLSVASRPLVDVMSVPLDRALNEYFEARDFAGMRSLLDRVGRKYAGSQLGAVDSWTTKLVGLAVEKRDAGQRQLAEKRYREAFESMQDVLRIWPTVEGGRKLKAAVETAYPMVFVGVTQAALDFDAERLDDWATRRTGRLVHRSLVEFFGAGGEGGQYQFALGSLDRSDDRRQLVLQVRKATKVDATSLNGYDVARRLLHIASPTSPDYVPSWESLIRDVVVKDVYRVEVDLRRPHVLPEAFLRVPLRRPSTAGEDSSDGPFTVEREGNKVTRFATKNFLRGGQLAEIVERSFDDSQDALGALRRGDIDVLDRLFPADALRARVELANNSAIRIEPYALPTVHILVPNLEDPFLANPVFRRAVLLAINRESILREELMGGGNFPGFQVISGPFPARSSESDPLGYAYDESTRPLPFNPYLAKVLLAGATSVVTKSAEDRGDPAPQLTPLVIGFPAQELSRIAVQAIAMQLRVIDLQVELREFPPGVTDDPQGDCDLVYKEIALWEPVIDARRMLGPSGAAATPSVHVQQALRWLDEAQTWSEARERLVDVHRAVYRDLAILPLWQTVDFFAYGARLMNVSPHPVWLYQNIDQWRLRVAGGME